jgi:hypothetical protein
MAEGRTLNLSKGARLVVATLFMGWMVGGTVYLLYCAFAFAGLVRWVGEWEMAHLGDYYWGVTFIAGIAVLMLPAVALVKLFPGSANAPITPRPVPNPAELQPGEARFLRALPWTGLSALAIALILGFIGYQKSSEPVVYEPFDVSRTTAEAPKHVELTGIAQTGFIIRHTETINGHTTEHTYLPLTAPGWRMGDPVAYFIQPTSPTYVDNRGIFPFDSRTPPFAVTFKGTLFRNDLPAVVAAGFEKGGLKMAPTVRVLDTRLDADEEIYFLIATPFGIAGLLFLVLAAITRLFVRRAASARPAH